MAVYTDTAKQVEKLMKALDITEEEAHEVMAYDKVVDKSKVKDTLPYDLTEAQEKISKEMRKSRKEAPPKPVTKEKNGPTIYALDNTQGKRSKKANPTKASIISVIQKAIEEHGVENLEVENPERLLSFTVDGNPYTITLTANRKKK